MSWKTAAVTIVALIAGVVMVLHGHEQSLPWLFVVVCVAMVLG